MPAKQGRNLTSGALAWQRLKNSVSETEPKDLVKFIVIAICLLLVYVQVVSFYAKLNNPGITTHTELKQNETMEYPAMTICREPPFDRSKYEKFNLGSLHAGSYPLMNQWERFPFDELTLTDFFTDAVYNSTQVFEFYGLGEWQNRTQLRRSVYLTLGQCFTLEPLALSKVVGKKNGFSVIVRHDLFEYRPLYDDVPGWNIYFHQTRESFSENKEILTGRQDHLFLRVGEEVEVNLDVMEFQNIRNCNNTYNYSSSKCEEKCWMDNIKNGVNCKGPWLPYIDLPECDNYTELSTVYRATIAMTFMNCCLPHCATQYFKTSVVSRTTLTGNRYNQSRIFVYYTSKALLSMEERFSYDWNLFVADLGGSLGFLLGLSVLGIVGVLEELVTLIWGGRQETEEKSPDLLKRGGGVRRYDTSYRLKLNPSFRVSPSVAAKIDRY